MSALAEDMMAALCGQRLLCLFAERAGVSSCLFYVRAHCRDTFSHREHWRPVSGLLHTSARVTRDYAHERLPSEA